jgi:hypothetical protein
MWVETFSHDQATHDNDAFLQSFQSEMECNPWDEALMPQFKEEDDGESDAWNDPAGSIRRTKECIQKYLEKGHHDTRGPMRDRVISVGTAVAKDPSGKGRIDGNHPCSIGSASSAGPVGGEVDDSMGATAASNNAIYLDQDESESELENQLNPSVFGNDSSIAAISNSFLDWSKCNIDGERESQCATKA